MGYRCHRASVSEGCILCPAFCCVCQGKWLYLEPIFSSEEIMKQIPKEGSAFRQMDATWRNIMAAVHLQPLIIQVTASFHDHVCTFDLHDL